ncbi:MAG TPA: hypothetical protein VEI03_22690 [Stellaceae bacterium]|nr:hypothetical protein [Stellaceae bacterium]
MAQLSMSRPARAVRRAQDALARRARNAAIIAAALPLLAAGATGPYDGTWQGASQGSMGAGCDTRTAAAFAVDGERVTGEEVIAEGSAMPAGRFPIDGTVAADGAFRGTVGRWDARGRFGGDAFDGDYEFGACTMLMRLTRIR